MQMRTITLAGRHVAAFADKDGLWARYDHIEAAGLTGIDIESLEITCRRVSSGTYVDVLAWFDPETFPSERYGLIYTDRQFIAGIRDWIASVLAIPEQIRVSYTEQGMQAEEYVSMEMSVADFEMLWPQTAHAKIALRNRPDIRIEESGDAGR